MLVLQKRLDLAMDEIQGLRIQVDDLQAQLNGRTEVLERRLELIAEQQEAVVSTIKKKSTGSGWIKRLEALAEEELKTPTAQGSLGSDDEHVSNCLQFSSPTFATMQIPGQFPVSNEEEPDIWSSSWMTEDFVVCCLAIFLRDARAGLVVFTLAALVLCFLGEIDTGGLCANLALVFGLGGNVMAMLERFWRRINVLHEAAQAYDLRRTDLGGPDATVKE